MTTRKTPEKSTTVGTKTPSRSKNPKPPAKSRLTPAVPKPPSPKAPATPAKSTPATTPQAATPQDDADAALKKQELLAKVVERSEIKKKYAKPVVEAMIAVLAETLAEGRELNLQPLGKLKHNRMKETDTARVIVTKIRQKKPRTTEGTPPKQGLADAAE